MTFPRWERRHADGSGRREQGTRPGAARRWCCGPTRLATTFDPEVAARRAAVLRSAGYRVIVPSRAACCGLTWMSTGQLDGAQRRLRALLDLLGPYAAVGPAHRRAGAVVHRGAPVRPGRPVPGRSPGGRGGRRHPHPGRAADLAGAAGPGRRVGAAQPRRLRVVGQTHCHQHAVLGDAADRGRASGPGPPSTR